MEDMIKLIPYIFLLICIAGVIGGAAVVTMSKFGNTMDVCYDSTYIISNGTTQTEIEINKSVTQNAATTLLHTYLVNGSFTIWNQTALLTVADYEITRDAITGGTINVSCSGTTVCVNASHSILNISYSYYPSSLSSGSACVRPAYSGSSGQGGLNLSGEYYTKIKGVEGLGSIAEQVPTVAIIAVMIIIISIISGVFIYIKMFG